MEMGRGLLTFLAGLGNLLLQAGKTFSTEFRYKKNFLLDGHTMHTKSTSQPVNLPSAWPLIFITVAIFGLG